MEKKVINETTVLNETNVVNEPVVEEVVVIQKKEKKKKRRLLILIFLMLMTGLLLSTSTYAWFTANQTVTVGTLTVNVEAQNGIQISADGTTWKSIVQTEDLKGVHATTYTSSVNQIPESMEPVSTGGNVDANGKMEMFYGVVASNNAGQYILTATKDEEAEGTTGKFIAFDLFFKVDADTEIFLTTNSGVTTEDAADTGIKNASRIAFVVLGNAAEGSAVSTIQGLNAGTSSPVYIWEPNYDVHTPAAISHAYDNYGVVTTETGGSVLAYDGVIDAVADTDNVVIKQANPNAYSTTWGTKFKAVVPSYTTVYDFSEKQQIFSLQKGVTKVRVYMWIEGQDVDCENSASGGTISYDLQITTPTE